MNYKSGINANSIVVNLSIQKEIQSGIEIILVFNRTIVVPKVIYMQIRTVVFSIDGRISCFALQLIYLMNPYDHELCIINGILI